MLDLLDGSTFDLTFVDANKENDLAYYDVGLGPAQTNGLILIDNGLGVAKVAYPDADDVDTRALRSINAALHADSRIDLALIPIGDRVIRLCVFSCSR